MVGGRCFRSISPIWCNCSGWIDKRKIGRGGVWRLPPTLGGYQRSPLPRFTVQAPEELLLMSQIFSEWAALLIRVLVPGAHLVVTTNPLLSTRVYQSIIEAGFEARGEFIRLKVKRSRGMRSACPLSYRFLTRVGQCLGMLPTMNSPTRLLKLAGMSIVSKRSIPSFGAAAQVLRLGEGT